MMLRFIIAFLATIVMSAGAEDTAAQTTMSGRNNGLIWSMAFAVPLGSALVAYIKHKSIYG